MASLIDRKVKISTKGQKCGCERREKSECSRLSHKRNLANLRERKRMMLINKGFEILRSKLPIKELKCNLIFSHTSTFKESSSYTIKSDFDDIKSSPLRSKRNRLTKVDILRLTIIYIKQLNKMLNEENSTQVSLPFKTLTLSKNSINPKVSSQMKFSDNLSLAVSSKESISKINRGKRRDLIESKRFRSSKQTKPEFKQTCPEDEQKKTVNRELVVYLSSSFDQSTMQSNNVSTTNGNETMRYLLSWSKSKGSIFDCIENDVSKSNKNQEEIILLNSKLWIPGHE